MLGLMFATLGCAGPAVEPPPPAPAKLVMANVSNQPWRVVVTAAAGGRITTAQLSPREERTMSLPAGVYDIDQTLLASGTTPERSRHLSCHLEAEQTYRWLLATLLADHPSDGR
jgi:hypothetical protein